MSLFKGKTAIVTGAGSGIGKALGEQLAKQGAMVILSDVNAERIRSVVDDLKSAGFKAQGLSLDVRDAEAVKTMVEDAAAEFGSVDYIFNNAGIGVGGAVHECCLEDWRNVLDINLYGVVNGVAAAYPIMVKQGSGHIVNTASIEGLCPFPGTVSYVASKYGVVGLSHALRVEGALTGVKVSVVCPGYVTTRIFHDAKVVGMNKEEMLKSLPPDWLGVTAEQCAKIILKGVRKNKGTIVVTAFAKGLWALNRINPALMQFIMKMGFKKAQRQLAK